VALPLGREDGWRMGV
jgi:hypothetical protein